MDNISEFIGDTITAYVTFVADEASIELTCEAYSDALKGSLKKTIKIKTILPTTSTLATTTKIDVFKKTKKTVATSPISTQTIISTTEKTRSEKKLMGLYNRPVADMPAEDEAYDYSHFDYLNDKFEENYKETVAFAEEYYDISYQSYENSITTLNERTETDARKTQLHKTFVESSAVFPQQSPLFVVIIPFYLFLRSK